MALRWLVENNANTTMQAQELDTLIVPSFVPSSGLEALGSFVRGLGQAAHNANKTKLPQFQLNYSFVVRQVLRSNRSGVRISPGAPLFKKNRCLRVAIEPSRLTRGCPTINDGRRKAVSLTSGSYLSLKRTSIVSSNHFRLDCLRAPIF
jgi:hypothetical protein